MEVLHIVEKHDTNMRGDKKPLKQRIFIENLLSVAIELSTFSPSHFIPTTL